MSLGYPPGPTDVPPNLTAPSAAYKRNAWLAMLGLATFIAVYFALSAWFALTAWRLLGGMFGAHGNFDLWGFIAGVCAAFLAVFMLKALFFIQHRFDIQDIEVTRADEPRVVRIHRPPGRRSPGAARAQGVSLAARQCGRVLRPVAAESHHPVEEEPRDRPRARQRGEPRRAQGGAGARVRALRAAFHGRGPLGVHRAADRRSRRGAARRAGQAAGATVAHRSARGLGGLAAVHHRLVDPLHHAGAVPAGDARRTRAVTADGVPGGSRRGVAHRQRRADPRAAPAQRGR